MAASMNTVTILTADGRELNFPTVDATVEAADGLLEGDWVQVTYRGAISEVNLLRKVRVAIAVNDEYVQPTIDGIIAGARTGHIGDGKIFVLPMDQCIRIRTGEHGPEAIG